VTGEDTRVVSQPSSAQSPPQTAPWRSAGTHRSWGGKHELPELQARLAKADGPSFARLSSILLRLALSSPGRLLGPSALRRSTLAEAVLAARQAIRSEDDSGWLAYTVFAHPGATCQPVPGGRAGSSRRSRNP
jgi:hypothetical protein